MITPDILLRAYASGIFPMAESAESTELLWFDPPVRALIPLDDRFHVSHSLRKRIRRQPYIITRDKAFGDVMRACAAPDPLKDRAETWINNQIIDLYTELHRLGYAHSIEAWQDGKLVGGLYGVRLGGAFFGESMFSKAADASKISLAYLVALLRAARFHLLDTQFTTDHLMQFGTFEVDRDDYHKMLADALSVTPILPNLDAESWLQLAAAQPTSQIS